MPRELEYLWVRGSRAVSTSLSTTWAGAGVSGLPMPKSMMSAPAARARAFMALTSAKTYGGKRRML